MGGQGQAGKRVRRAYQLTLPIVQNSLVILSLLPFRSCVSARSTQRDSTVVVEGKGSDPGLLPGHRHWWTDAREPDTAAPPDSATGQATSTTLSRQAPRTPGAPVTATARAARAGVSLPVHWPASPVWRAHLSATHWRIGAHVYTVPFSSFAQIPRIDPRTRWNGRSDERGTGSACSRPQAKTGKNICGSCCSTVPRVGWGSRGGRITIGRLGQGGLRAPPDSGHLAGSKSGFRLPDVIMRGALGLFIRDRKGHMFASRDVDT